jgi:DNA polymerase-1
MSAFGLSQNLGIERSAAQAYMAKYFQRYPGWRRTWSARATEARERGYVETVFGRRLWLPRHRVREPGAARGCGAAGDQRTHAGDRRRTSSRLAMIAVQSWLEKEMLATKLVIAGCTTSSLFEVPDAESRA